MKELKGMKVFDAPRSDVPILKNHIGGSWKLGGGAEFALVESPATGLPLAILPLGARSDAQDAIDAARKAAPVIAAMTVWERAAMCNRIADAIERRRDDLAMTLALEQGKPLYTEAYPEVDGAAAGFRNGGEQMKWIETSCINVETANKLVFNYLQPKGVIAAISPWNYPISLPAMYYLGPGLAAGNAFVWVAAPATSMCAVKLMECLVDADVPPGVVNLVLGNGEVVGDEIVANPGTDAIAFTGSVETGGVIAKRAAGKHTMLELGGNGPTIVLDDADLDLAAPRIARGCFLNAGQVCTSTERILVHKSRHDELVERLVEQANAVVLGVSTDKGVTMGPLNNRPTKNKVAAHVGQAVEGGAKLHVGGHIRANMPTDLYFEPTVLSNVAIDMDIHTEETFGPVAPVTAFETDDELWQLVEASSFGLSAGVFSTSGPRAQKVARRLRHGLVNINDMSTYWEMPIPVGGAAGTKSGLGRTGGKASILEMSDLKSVTIDVT